MMMSSEIQRVFSAHMLCGGRLRVPQCHSGNLAAMYYPDMKTSALKKTPYWLQNFDEISVPLHAYKPVLGCQGHPKKSVPSCPAQRESEPQMHVLYSVSSCLSR